MSLKLLRYGLAGTGGLLVAGGLIFGSELMSYMRTSAGSVRESVREAVPIEFELQRARDMINQILPELHAGIRMIAEDEVEIAAIESDIKATRHDVQEQRTQLASLRDMLRNEDTSFRIGGREVPRAQVAERLAQCLNRVRDADMILASKQKLLENRRQSLAAALRLLEQARSRKIALEQKVASLVAQHRLVQAAAVGSRVHVSDTQLARADQLLAAIQKRLDVAERVLEYESSGELSVNDDVSDEVSLLAEVDEHLNAADEARPGVAAVAPSSP